MAQWRPKANQWADWKHHSESLSRWKRSINPDITRFVYNNECKHRNIKIISLWFTIPFIMIYITKTVSESFRQFPRDLSTSVWYVRPTRCLAYLYLEKVQVQVGWEVIKKLNIGKTLSSG